MRGALRFVQHKLRDEATEDEMSEEVPSPPGEANLKRGQGLLKEWFWRGVGEREKF